MLEKWCVFFKGKNLNCVFDKVVSSRAIKKPIIVTKIAVNLMVEGIVIMGDFAGTIFEVITRPAMMLPQANRLIAFRLGLEFSLMGGKTENRGVSIETKKITRKLYTAVNDVASRVNVRAHAFRYELFNVSMITSFEKNPARKGVPVKAIEPKVMQDEVSGVS